jgi:lysylphosphatidylglycerol synthetase-like protein (DUF2156 family)
MTTDQQYRDTCHASGLFIPTSARIRCGVLSIYPHVTGLVAGAFIMASLVRVFVKALEPVYRLSLLTAFAFLLCALCRCCSTSPAATLLRI